MSPVDQAELRRVSGYFATGVTIVTASREGTPCGLTVNSFTSLSLDPRLVLVCVNRNARSYPCLEAAEHFAVNVIARGQVELSRRFASQEKDKFAGLSFHAGALTGAPILGGVHAWLECRVLERFPGGNTHTVFIGSVEAVGTGVGEPLLYYRGSYAGLAPLPDR